MDECPVIETSRLSIVPFSEEYVTPRYAGWLNDREVVRYSEQRHRSHTLETCRSYWRSFSGSPNYFWAILVKESPLGHVGNMSAHVDRANSLADVGILIGERAAWRQGYGLEAWKAVCGYLLETGGLHKVTAGALEANEAMLRIMKRSGMVEDGRRIRHYLLDGEERDVVYGALFARS